MLTRRIQIASVIIAVCGFWWLFLAAVPVFALPVVTFTDLWQLDVKANGAANVHYQMQLTNNQSEKVVSQLSLTLPWEVTMQGASVAGADATYSLEGNQLTVDLGQFAVKPSQQKQIDLRFNVSHLLHQDTYLPSVSLHKLSNDSISTLVEVSWDSQIGQLIYSSFDARTRADTKVSFTGDGATLLIWQQGDSVIDISETLNVQNESDKSVIFNLPPTFPGQEVLFDSLNKVAYAGTDDLDNVWAVGLAGEQMDYSARVSLTDAPSEFQGYSYLGELPANAIPISLLESPSSEDSLRQIYQQVLQQLSPQDDLATSWDNLALLNTELNTQTNSIGYAYRLVSILKSFGIPHQIKYGYLLTMAEKFDPIQPTAWVEVLLDGQIYRLDPYLEDVTGLDQFGTAQGLRLTMGVWNQTLPQDTALGLIGGSIRPRPQIINMGREFMPTPVQYLLSISYPQQVYSGEFYQIGLKATNQSNYIVPITQLVVDGYSVTEKYLQLADQINLALLPKSTTHINLDYLRETNFLLDQNRVVRVNVVPEDILPTKTVTATIMFTPDMRLLYAGFFAVLVMMVVSGLLLLRALKWRVLIARFSQANQEG